MKPITAANKLGIYLPAAPEEFRNSPITREALDELRDDADPAGDFDAQTRFTPWTSVFNLTGRPAISLPLHNARIDGADSPVLPIGVMLGAPFGADDVLLGLSAALESVAPWERPGR